MANLRTTFRPPDFVLTYRRFYPQELGDNLDAKKVLSTIMNCDILKANQLELKSTALKLAFGFGRGEKSRKPDL